MINFIINDVYNEAVKTKTIIEKYMMNYDLEVKYHLFESEEKIKEKIRNIKGFNVYILNIDLLKQNGKNIIEFIRLELEDWNSVILVVTKYCELKNKIAGNRLFIFDVILKKYNYNDLLISDLDNILKYYNNRHNCLTFESNRVLNKLDFRNIDMITKEKDSKKCMIKSSVGNYYTCESLNSVSKRLDNRFIKINRGCIINGDKIIEYNSSENKLTLKNGIITYDISRDNKKALLSKFENYK